MQNTKKNTTALTLALTLLLTAAPLPNATDSVQASVKLSNPVIKYETWTEADPETGEQMEQTSKEVTWDCIWFGSYPQSEIITSDAFKDYKAEYEHSGYSWAQYSFMEADDALYQELKDADGWNASGDITIRGIRYRRRLWKDMAGAKALSVVKYPLKTKPAADSYSHTDQHITSIDWKDGKTYRYFRYEPIKWRVLSTDGKKALLLSDLAIDCFGYCQGESGRWSLDTRWENSIFRNWLNGYKTAEKQDVYLTEGDFINSAFSKKEKKKILTTKLSNKDNSKTGTDAGKDTKDKVFLLSEDDIFSEQGYAYGFKEVYDLFPGSYRRTIPTGYAAASGTPGMDAYSTGWLLRTPGDYPNIPMAVNNIGEKEGYMASRKKLGLYQIRPAITLDLASNELWDYAGKVYNDGDDKLENLTGQIAITGSTDKLLAGKKLTLGIIELPSGSKGKDIVWSTSNGKYATVSQKGVVTAKKAGIGKTVTITARMKGRNHVTAACKIKIVKDAVKSIRLSSKKGKKIIEGTALQLSADVKTTGKTAGKGLIWSCSNEKYAAVSPSGTVTAKKAGIGKTVTITAKAADQSGVSAKYNLTIIKDEILKISLVSPKEQKAALGSRKNIKVKVTRRSGTLTGLKAARLLDWSAKTDNRETWCTYGHVRCDDKGTVTVTAKAGKKKVKAIIKVK